MLSSPLLILPDHGQAVVGVEFRMAPVPLQPLSLGEDRMGLGLVPYVFDIQHGLVLGSPNNSPSTTQLLQTG